MIILRKRLTLSLMFVFAISLVAGVPSLQAGPCSDAFAKCLDNMSTSWWKGPLDFIECLADFAACLAKKF